MSTIPKLPSEAQSRRNRRVRFLLIALAIALLSAALTVALILAPNVALPIAAHASHASHTLWVDSGMNSSGVCGGGVGTHCVLI